MPDTLPSRLLTQLLRITLLSLALSCLTNFGLAVVIVSRPGPDSGAAVGVAGSVGNAYGIGWSQTQTYQNVTITARLFYGGSFQGSTSGNVNAFLSTSIGAGSVAFASQTVAIPITATAPADIKLFTGLTLGPGNYYLTVAGTNTLANPGWELSNANITTDAGATFVGQYRAASVNLAAPYQSINAVSSTLEFAITGDAAPPLACTNAAAPVIASVTSASAYGGYPYFASGSWLEIKGSNLAEPSDPRLAFALNPGQWIANDFTGANAPISLDGISASVNGKPAYVWYLSTGQINVQAPQDSATGNVAVTVTNCKGTSAPFTVQRQALAPGLLAPSNYTANGTQYLVATFASDGAYVLDTSTGASFGLNSRPAKPGDLIIAYGVGFGDVTPSILPGVVVQQGNAVSNPVTVSFGSANAAISYAGLAGNFVGLYEFYITVPPGLANGDYQINVKQNGVSLPQTVHLTVRN